MSRPNAILDKSFEMAIEVVRFSKKLQADREFDLASQVFRSGTSVGANVREAQNAESKADFIHKMKIAVKECEETIFWLELCSKSTLWQGDLALLNLAQEIKKILNAIIGTSKRGGR